MASCCIPTPLQGKAICWYYIWLTGYSALCFVLGCKPSRTASSDKPPSRDLTVSLESMSSRVNLQTQHPPSKHIFQDTCSPVVWPLLASMPSRTTILLPVTSSSPLPSSMTQWSYWQVTFEDSITIAHDLIILIKDCLPMSSPWLHQSSPLCLVSP